MIKQNPRVFFFQAFMNELDQRIPERKIFSLFVNGLY